MAAPLAKAPERKNPFEGTFPALAEFTIGTETSNAINVSVQLLTGGEALYDYGYVDAYLSDAATGVAVAASAPSGGWAIGTNGSRLWQYVTNVAGKFQSAANGVFDVTITESTAKTFYVVVILPDGSAQVSDAVTFA